MSVSTVIGDTTNTLRQLLLEQQTLSFQVSLRSPADEAVDPASPKINLYLFRIERNAFANNLNFIPVETEVFHYPPLALDLFYVLTPYAEEQDQAHRVLGEAMRILYDNAIIPSASLSGSLEHSDAELKVDLCQFSLEDLTRVWNAFSIPYRLSVCYQIRMVFVDSLLEHSTKRVREKENQHGSI